MICRIKEKKTSIMIICAAFLWTATFPGVSWGLEAPGGGKAVDGTIHNVPVADISKGSDIVNAPRISGTPDSSVLDSSAPNNSSASDASASSPAALSAAGMPVPEGSGSPVLVCGASKTAVMPKEPLQAITPGRGASLGMFVTTGYCLCEECSGGFELTYSGTVPQAGHTVSADISLFPIGTRLMIGNTVYTVEDIGSNVKGNHIDIYYNNHEEAMAHGRKTEEVFAVQ